MVDCLLDLFGGGFLREAHAACDTHASCKRSIQTPHGSGERAPSATSMRINYEGVVDTYWHARMSLGGTVGALLVHHLILGGTLEDGPLAN